MDIGDGFLNRFKHKSSKPNDEVSEISYDSIKFVDSDEKDCLAFQTHSETCSSSSSCTCPTVFLCPGNDSSQLIRVIEANLHGKPNTYRNSSSPDHSHITQSPLGVNDEAGSHQNIPHADFAPIHEPELMSCAPIDEVDRAPIASNLLVLERVELTEDSISFDDLTKIKHKDFTDAVHPRTNRLLSRPPIEELLTSICLVCHQPLSDHRCAFNILSVTHALQRVHGRGPLRLACCHCTFTADHVPFLLEHVQKAGHAAGVSACRVCRLPLLCYKLNGRPWQLHVCTGQLSAQRTVK